MFYRGQNISEVVLQSTKKITVNSDTTTIQVKPFITNTEQTIEDVLKNLPGIQVLPNGIITAHGKEIKKLLVEGEDIFDKDYKILSKNLDANVLKAVQIIDGFEDNPILKKYINSEEVALNLVLKEDKKNIWFGNVTGGIGTKDRFKVGANIGLIKKKIKFFYFGDYENLGQKAYEQLSNSNQNINFSNTYREKKIEKQTQVPFSIEKNENFLFEEGQSTFNKALLNSLSYATTLSDKIKLRGNINYTNDIQRQNSNSQTSYFIDVEPIVFNEENKVEDKKSVLAGTLELKYFQNERSYFTNELSFDARPERVSSNLIFNDTQIDQNLKNKNYSFYNHLNHTYSLSANSIVHNYFYAGLNNIDQNSNVRSSILNGLFEQPQDALLLEPSNNSKFSYGFNTSLISKITERIENNLELAFDGTQESQETNFNFINNQNITSLDSLQNNIFFHENVVKLRNRIKYKFSKKIELSLGAEIDY